MTMGDNGLIRGWNAPLRSFAGMTAVMSGADGNAPSAKGKKETTKERKRDMATKKAVKKTKAPAKKAAAKKAPAAKKPAAKKAPAKKGSKSK